MPRRKHGSCTLCERERPLTFHHLVPRAVHSKKWCRDRFTKEERQQGIDICPDCHGAIHRFISEAELGKERYSVALLLEHPELGRFVEWIRGRDIGRVRTRRTRR